MLGDFNREQEKFVTEKKENKKHEEAAVPPWVGYNEEETMKNQILALSLVSALYVVALSFLIKLARVRFVPPPTPWWQ